MDGLQLCKKIRAFNDITPIIFLTVKDSVEERIRALEEGADDFFTKPMYSYKELLIKIKNLLMRTYGENAFSIIKIGNAEIDMVSRTVRKNGREERKLTRVELRLLQFLYAKRNNLLTRGEIMAAVWGPFFPDRSRTLDNYIHRLRELIEDDPSNPNYILTEKGMGYILKLERE